MDDREDAIIGTESLNGWEAWLGSPAGRYVLDWEQHCFDEAVVDVFGYNALQCGTPLLDCLRSNRMPNRVRAEVGRAALGRTGDGPALLIDQFEALPFASQSVDLVVLPHVLEFSADPYQVLREVDRVLRPEGRVILSGFNPVSLWGLRETFGQAVGRPWLPDSARLITLLRLRDWLKLLSYAPADAEHGCFRPALARQSWLDRFAFLERAGDRWWPILGAVYVVAAVKRVPGMTLQGPVWRSRVSRRSAAALTSHRDTCSRESAAAGLAKAPDRSEV